ncbi:MAG: helix-turn-helix domain-containing protein [Patescibacteria group bacterium]|nr:helix-turn-helix domain-containing protein [Patescibacteria group bacterium]
MAHIRQTVFGGISQAAFGDIAGTTQTTVSRWESGLLEPDRKQMELIRTAAVSSGKEWDDSWFFEIPEQAA